MYVQHPQATVSSGAYGAPMSNPYNPQSVYTSKVNPQSYYSGAQRNLTGHDLLKNEFASSRVLTHDAQYPGKSSYVPTVVETGLFTNYIPAARYGAEAAQAAQPATEHELARIHAGRMNQNQKLTVYYTDDLYPPYYAKARKITSTKRGRPACCQ